MGGDLLVVDIGNTNVVLGVYRGKNLLAHWRLHTRSPRTEDELSIAISQLFAMDGMDMKSIGDAIISCVAPQILPEFVRFCANRLHCQALLVGPGVKTGVSVKTDDPREVGADRITNAAGALAKYKPPLIIVDFGTAITIDAISANCEYLGGAIAPGMGLAAAALSANTAKLPKVELTQPPSVIGTNTVDAMRSGLFNGFAGMVDGIVRRMLPLLGGKATVIATGGEAALVAGASETIEKVEENLTLEGLRVIHENTRKAR